MEINREEIYKAEALARQLQRIKFVHYRDCYSQVDTTNFQISTQTDFKEVGIDEGKNAKWQFNLIAAQPNIIYNFTSRSGSKYLIDTDGNVYRLSNHWGAVASCVWTLEGRGELCMSLMVSGEWEIGVSNLRDFTVYRRKEEKRRDFMLNPEWINQIKTLIPIKDELKAMKADPEFKSLDYMDKNLIGTTLGRLEGEIRTIPV